MKKKKQKKIYVDVIEGEVESVGEGREIVVASSQNPVPLVDFEKAFKQALVMFTDQALLTKDPEKVSLESIELTKAKANSFLDSINNLLHVAHLNELISADKMKFKRIDELSALNALLQSFRLAAEASQRSVTFLVREMDSILLDLGKQGMDAELGLSAKDRYGFGGLGDGRGKGRESGKKGIEIERQERKKNKRKRREDTYDGLGDDDDEDWDIEERGRGRGKGESRRERYEEDIYTNGRIHEAGKGNGGESEGGVGNEAAQRMYYISQALSNSIDNLNKLGSGLTRVIQLERYSGARGWGNMKSSPNQIGYVKGLGDDPEKGREVGASGRRKLSAEELQYAAAQAEIDGDEEEED